MRNYVAIAATLVLAGCTIIIHDKNDGGGKVEPRHAQMLWLVNVDRSSVNMADAYEAIIRDFVIALAAQTNPVIVDKLAIMPLNRTTIGGPRLIYGEALTGAAIDPKDLTREDAADAGVDPGAGGFPIDIPGMQSGGIAAALRAAAASDFFREPDPDHSEQANLAEIGRDLGSQVIYDPNGSDVGAAAFFAVPADAFIVGTISHLRRACAINESTCRVDGAAPAAYFTAKTDTGASWLRFGGGVQLPLERIFHVEFVTAEQQTDADFFTSCTKTPGFPVNFIDLMEPSAKAYYGPFADGVDDVISGHAINENLCTMLGATRLVRQILHGKQIADELADLK